MLGRHFRTDRDLDDAIREGFPQKVVTEVMNAADLTLKELADSLDLSARSLQRRRGEGRLAKYESDRIYRLARCSEPREHQREYSALDYFYFLTVMDNLPNGRCTLQA